METIFTKPQFLAKSKVWVYPGVGGWRFVSVPKKQSAVIRKTFAGLARGFGSLPVHVTLGGTSWDTSIFPDSKTGTYLLALKAAVRKQERVHDGQVVRFSFHVRTSKL